MTHALMAEVQMDYSTKTAMRRVESATDHFNFQADEAQQKVPGVYDAKEQIRSTHKKIAELRKKKKISPLTKKRDDIDREIDKKALTIYAKHKDKYQKIYDAMQDLKDNGDLQKKIDQIYQLEAEIAEMARPKVEEIRKLGLQIDEATNYAERGDINKQLIKRHTLDAQIKNKELVLAVDRELYKHRQELVKAEQQLEQMLSSQGPQQAQEMEVIVKKFHGDARRHQNLLKLFPLSEFAH